VREVCERWGSRELVRARVGGGLVWKAVKPLALVNEDEPGVKW
jgi:hypothetical protein